MTSVATNKTILNEEVTGTVQLAYAAGQAGSGAQLQTRLYRDFFQLGDNLKLGLHLHADSRFGERQDPRLTGQTDSSGQFTTVIPQDLVVTSPFRNDAYSLLPVRALNLQLSNADNSTRLRLGWLNIGRETATNGFRDLGVGSMGRLLREPTTGFFITTPLNIMPETKLGLDFVVSGKRTLDDSDLSWRFFAGASDSAQSSGGLFGWTGVTRNNETTTRFVGPFADSDPAKDGVTNDFGQLVVLNGLFVAAGGGFGIVPKGADATSFYVDAFGSYRNNWPRIGQQAFSGLLAGGFIYRGMRVGSDVTYIGFPGQEDQYRLGWRLVTDFTVVDQKKSETVIQNGERKEILKDDYRISLFASAMYGSVAGNYKPTSSDIFTPPEDDGLAALGAEPEQATQAPVKGPLPRREGLDAVVGVRLQKKISDTISLFCNAGVGMQDQWMVGDFRCEAFWDLSPGWAK